MQQVLVSWNGQPASGGAAAARAAGVDEDWMMDDARDSSLTDKAVSRPAAAAGQEDEVVDVRVKKKYIY